jgi:hypothetical protein
MTTFTTADIFNKINNWTGKPLCKEALSALMYFFVFEDEDVTYTYKNDNIEAFILETLSQITE